jgi:hypothetical protein
MKISGDIGVWVGALTALCIYSVLYRENPAYRLVENIFVGASAGIAVVAGVQTFQSIAWNPLVKGNVVLVLPIVLGVLLYARFVPGVSYLNRIPLAFLMGASAGVAMRGSIESQIIGQISATMIRLDNLDALVIFAGTVLSLGYFFLTYKFGGAYTQAAMGGRYFMMAAFGAAFGNTVMGRVSAAIGRFQFILLKWLGLG